MTDRKALQTLLEKVKAGEADGRCRLAQAAFGPLAKLAWAAQDGSIDAAKALHEAVLPGWDVDVNIRLVLSDVWIFQDMPDGGTRHWIGTHEDPARAWLIAILEALIAQEGET